MTKKRKSSAQKRIFSTKVKKKFDKKTATFSFYLGLLLIATIFLLSFFKSESETFTSKLNDAFLETVKMLNITAEDYSSTGIVSKNLKLSKIQEGYPKILVKYNEIETYSGFHLSYNEKHEQANWVAYILTKKMVRNNKVDRTDNFRSDKNIKTKSASLNDYRGTGYDRGHLAPAADMHWSELSMSESFLMSNMSPQEDEFNRGVWKKLEEQVRDFAVENETIFVVTGPVFKNIKKKIGKNKVSVPKYYYKVILDISPPAYKGIAFLLENEKSSKDLYTFAMSIDDLEKFTEIDFFHYISDSTLDKIEATYNVNDWNL